MWRKKEEKKSLESISFIDKSDEYLLSNLAERYLEYALYELNFSIGTIVRYRDSLKSFRKDIGDRDIRELTLQDFVTVKRLMAERGLSVARISGVIFAMRSLLNYCRKFLKIQTINPKEIRAPKHPKREVIFLTPEEVNIFIETIDTKRLSGLRFRALVEVLLGTGMRISEALSLNRMSIDWEKKEAKIVGKGNKERRIFFNDSALFWVKKYLEARDDCHEAIFVTRGEVSRLLIGDIWRFFRYHREKSRIQKKITPHILRHTVATNLLFNGCPIVHVKEILGHEKLDTTCKYYLGVDKEIAKRAHKEYLKF